MLTIANHIGNYASRLVSGVVDLLRRRTTPNGDVRIAADGNRRVSANSN